MQQQRIEIHGNFVSPQERSRLVWLCATITGDVNAAEDLAQETLLEAWRLEHTLRDKSKHTQWLSGIARNICLRWLRKHGRDIKHLTDQSISQERGLSNIENSISDDFDMEVELERKELIQLLDLALALLPPETRTVLIKRYVEESSLAEIAAQLQTNASAIAMRLQRGKLSLRRVLTRDMFHEIAPYVILPAEEEWEQTPLWCHICGQCRLLGKRDPAAGKLLLKCPICSPGVDEVISNNDIVVLQGINGYKPLYSRVKSWCDTYYRTGLRNGTIPCIKCGQLVNAVISLVSDLPSWPRNVDEKPTCSMPDDERIVCVLCPYCRIACQTTLHSLVLFSPASRQFVQAHARIRMLPDLELEIDGRRAIMTRFESITDGAKLIAISDYHSYELMHIYEKQR